MDCVQAKNIIIDKVDVLPTLPDMIHKVLNLVQDEDTSAKELGNLIAYDQAISARLLKVANSAYYGFMKKIETVKQSIIILGFNEVKTLALGIAVFDIMKEDNSEISLNREDFWLHSVGCAQAGQIIGKKAGGVDTGNAFTAGLLHDIGKLVLDNFFTTEYGQALQKVQKNGVSMVEAEQEVMGFSHADVGGWLAERWKFPLVLSAPISFHHKIEQAPMDYLQITSIVHLADVLCKQAGIGDSGDNNIYAVQPKAFKNLALHEEDLKNMVAQLTKEEEKVKAFISAMQ